MKRILAIILAAIIIGCAVEKPKPKPAPVDSVAMKAKLDSIAHAQAQSAPEDLP